MKNFIKTITISVILIAIMTGIAIGALNAVNQPKSRSVSTITYSNGETFYKYEYK